MECDITLSKCNLKRKKEKNSIIYWIQLSKETYATNKQRNNTFCNPISAQVIMKSDQIEVTKEESATEDIT